MAQPKITFDLRREEWREYVIGSRVYRIDRPVSVTLNTGQSVHYVKDYEGIVHVVPAPGVLNTVVRYHSKDPDYQCPALLHGGGRTLGETHDS